MKDVLKLIALIGVTQTAGAETQTFTTTTTDGITVHGELYTSPGVSRDAPLILLFHQGASNGRAEYEPLAPRLLEQGYNLISIDQRRGGERFGGLNRTLAGVGDTEYSYCDVMPDLEAALAYARESGFDGPTVAWGSSYSAALIFKLALDHPDEIDAVIAFSSASGEPMEGCMPEMYSGEVTQPVLALRPTREMQVPYVPGQMELFSEQGHQTYVADPAVHGSSMLNETRVGSPVEETWAVVLGFLEASLPVSE
jgi:pimeloyl-ACP methyl ester carboxylesterase